MVRYTILFVLYVKWLPNSYFLDWVDTRTPSCSSWWQLIWQLCFGFIHRSVRLHDYNNVLDLFIIHTVTPSFCIHFQLTFYLTVSTVQLIILTFYLIIRPWPELFFFNYDSFPFIFFFNDGNGLEQKLYLLLYFLFVWHILTWVSADMLESQRCWREGAGGRSSEFCGQGEILREGSGKRDRRCLRGY